MWFNDHMGRCILRSPISNPIPFSLIFLGNNFHLFYWCLKQISGSSVLFTVLYFVFCPFKFTIYIVIQVILIHEAVFCPFHSSKLPPWPGWTGVYWLVPQWFNIWITLAACHCNKSQEAVHLKRGKVPFNSPSKVWMNYQAASLLLSWCWGNISWVWWRNQLTSQAKPQGEWGSDSHRTFTSAYPMM